MTEGESKNKIITVGLVIVIFFAIAVLVYVNLPEQENEDQETELRGYVNVIYDDQSYNFSLNDLIKMDLVEGTGNYIKLGWLPEIVIDGPFNYSGVDMTTILGKIEDLPDQYNITVTASDGKESIYSYEEIIGNVDIYNNTGNITGNGGVKMILAFKHDGEYIEDPEEGPIRIAFVDDGSITSSRLWTKLVVSIEINVS
jgi:hypothetical protein